LNVTLSATSGSRFLFIGGAVGVSNDVGDNKSFTDTAELTDIVSAGTVKINKTNYQGGENKCGGIGGDLRYTNLTNCRFTGKIEIPNTFNAIGATYIGGIIGMYLYKGTAANCEASGDITVRASRMGDVSITNEAGEVDLGGVVGQLCGDSSSSSTNILAIENSRYINGTISLGIGEVKYLRAGGFMGGVYNRGRVINCRSGAKVVETYVTGNCAQILAGGFSGELGQVTLSGCSGSSPVSIPVENTTNAAVHSGGFSGNIYSRGAGASLTDCFATGNVTVYCNNASATIGSENAYTNGNWIGGLIGGAFVCSGTNGITIEMCYATGNVTAVNSANSTDFAFNTGGLVGLAHGTTIRKCYATGNVNASKGTGGTVPVAAGGLVGFLGYNTAGVGQTSSISDCYAKGSVTADNPQTGAASASAGGLIGYMNINNTNAIDYCFATGEVIAQSNSAGCNAGAGGLVGYINNGQVRNSAALGASVTVSGGDTRQAGRVFGNDILNTNNYAWDKMTLYESGTYGAQIQITPLSPDPAGSNRHGETKNIADFVLKNFWLGLNFNTVNNGIGEIKNIWNFTGIESRGYPLLNGVGGQ